jgi:hypothetical protein
LEENMSKWEDSLWEELDTSSPSVQYQLISEYIYLMSQHVLPKLGDRRRQVILQALKENPEMDAIQFAEETGASPNTVKRLLGDARAAARRRS